MTMRVFKHAVPIDDNEHSFFIGAETKILHVAEQHGAVAFWFEHDDSQPKFDMADPRDRRTFRVFGTGHPIPTLEPHEYVGTALLIGGNMVVHLYEVL